jgi:acyl carrier protein
MVIDSKPLKDYLLGNIIKNKEILDENESLFSSGLIDSFGMLDLIFFIREQYHVVIEDYDIADNHVDTIKEIIAMIEKRK